MNFPSISRRKFLAGAGAVATLSALQTLPFGRLAQRQARPPGMRRVSAATKAKFAQLQKRIHEQAVRLGYAVDRKLDTASRRAHKFA